MTNLWEAQWLIAGYYEITALFPPYQCTSITEVIIFFYLKTLSCYKILLRADVPVQRHCAMYCKCLSLAFQIY